MTTRTAEQRRVEERILAEAGTRIKMSYLDEGAAPSHRWYVWVAA